MKKMLLAAAAATAMISTAAFAAVTFDSATGTGFVGKGDVQIAYGWNNAQLQSNAKDVRFSYESLDRYEVTCEWYTGPAHNRNQHEVDHKRSTSVQSAVSYEARKNTQGSVNGFILKGFGATTTIGDAPPLVGSTTWCPGAPGNGAVVTDVVSTGTSGGALFANYGGTGVQIDPPVL